MSLNWKCNILIHYWFKQFAVLIALILIAEIGGGIAAYVFRADVEDLLTSGMNDTLQKYGEDEGITNLWNETQSGVCCLCLLCPVSVFF